MISGLLEGSLIKMKMKLKLFVCLFFALGILGAAQAQEPNWPEDPEKRKKAEEKYVLTNDYTKQDNYEEAVKHFRWLYTETPELSKGIYINGIKIYRGLAEKAEGEQEKLYADTLMNIYDKRIELYNDEADQRDRQAFDSYQYYKDHKDRYAKSMGIFKKAFELNGKKVMTNNLIAYQDMARRYKLTQPDSISDDEILEIYELNKGILDQQIAALKERGRNTEKFEKVHDQLDKLLAATINVDCDFVATKMYPKLQEDTTNLKLAKNIFRFSLIGKCTDTEAALEAAKVIQAQEPTYGMAKFIAIKNTSDKKFDEAEKYYKQAIELTEEESEKAEMYINLAKLSAGRGQKVTAKKYAQDAMAADPSYRSEAYTMIGNLYMSSYEDCKQGENPVKDRGVYLAAYEMYKKAGNTQAMKTAQEQFPSMEEIFTYGMKVGDQITVGCWINETVTIQKR
jgi:tetratricopeptide (TPR) repeat protein